MTAKELLQYLPPFKGDYELITPDQSVGDIIAEVLEAHEVFAPDYNEIALFFDADTIDGICKKLYSFCKRNFVYDEQGEDNQMSMSPAAMLTMRTVDCKNYSGFCAGILDGLKRMAGKKINFCYRFASYRLWDTSPHHVFVVIDPGKNEIWIDPTPGSANKLPVWYTDKKPKAMALNRVSGMGSADASLVLDETVENPPLYMAVQRLLKYGVMNLKGQISDQALLNQQNKISSDEFLQLRDDLDFIKQSAIGGLGENIMHALALVSQALPRASFLSLVFYNMFGWATKLAHAIYTDDTMTSYYAAGKDKVYHRWYELGGDFAKLERVIKLGAKKKAILGNSSIGATVGNPAAVAAACVTIIAALKPIIDDILKTRQQQTGINYDIDPTTGLPYGTQPTGTSNLMDWVSNHPLEIIAFAFGLSWLLKQNKKQTSNG